MWPGASTTWRGFTAPRATTPQPQTLNNLARLYRNQGNHVAAERLFKRLLAIREKALEPEHPDVATSLNNLAELYDIRANYAAAEPLYKRL